MEIPLYGGNKWADICSEIIYLLKSLESKNEYLIAQLLEKIPQMKHNTNGVGKKLKELEENAP